jgi:hypothetical protein
MIKKILDFIMWPYRAARDEWRFRQRLKELKKKDPFTYK